MVSPLIDKNICSIKVFLENGWNSKQMITEGEPAIPLETTLDAFRNQNKTKQISTIVKGSFQFKMSMKNPRVVLQDQDQPREANDVLMPVI